MVQPIPSQPGQSISPPSDTHVSAAAQQMQQHLSSMVQQMQSFMGNPLSATDSSSLQDFATNLQQLHLLVQQVLKSGG